MTAPFRFFQDDPKKGRPIAAKGNAAALRDIARALEHMDVFGGRVDWNNRVPLLITPEFNGYQGGNGPLPFDVRVVDGRVQFYYVNNGYNMVGYNVDQGGLPPESILLLGSAWEDIGPVGTGGTVSVYVHDPQSAARDFARGVGRTWKIVYGHGIVPTNALAELTATPIATLDVAGIITQIRRGGIRINVSAGDAQIAGDVNAIVRQRSLEKYGGNDGVDQIYGFAAPDEPADNTALRASLVMVRNVVAGIPEVRYKVFSEIETLIIQSTLDSIDWTSGVEGVLGEYDGEANPFPVPHKFLTDIVDQSVDDDHRGGRTAAGGIGDGGDPETFAHPYIHANGDATRNAMTVSAFIGTENGEKCIHPARRELYGVNEWPTLNWDFRQPAIADAETSHAVSTPDDMNDAFDALGTKINSILAALRQYKIIEESS